MNLTREQTIKAVEICSGTDDCAGCPLFGVSLDADTCAKIKNENVLIYLKENEPAPSANDTSSEKNISHSDFTTISEICQELDKRINGDFLIAYNRLDRAGQLAFELGRDYARFTDRRQK